MGNLKTVITFTRTSTLRNDFAHRRYDTRWLFVLACSVYDNCEDLGYRHPTHNILTSELRSSYNTIRDWLLPVATVILLLQNDYSWSQNGTLRFRKSNSKWIKIQFTR